MKKIIATMITLVMALSLFAGCQKSPESPIVVGKNNDQLLEVAQTENNAPVLEQVQAPGSYQSSAESKSGKIKVRVDANVELPNTDKISILQVVNDNFTQEFVDKAIAVLLKDGPVYDAKSVQQKTKAELQEGLLALKLRKAELEAQGMRPLAGDLNELPQNEEEKNAASAVEMNELDQVNQSITALESLIVDAPETANLKPSDKKFTIAESGNEWLSVAQPNEGAAGAKWMWVSNNATGGSFHYADRKDKVSSYGTYYSYDQVAHLSEPELKRAMEIVPAPEMTAQEAQTIAQGFLADMGIEDMNLAFVEEVVGGSSVLQGGGSNLGEYLKGYRLRFVRTVEGTPIVYTNFQVAWDPKDSMSAPWSYEDFNMIVNDSGIVEVNWEAKYAISKSVLDKCALRPFEEIADVFNKMILIENAMFEENGVKINISDINLGYTRVMEQNNNTYGLLVPTWNFYGTRTVYFKDDSGQLRENPEYEKGLCLLTINAIDGSIIDRNIGY